MSGGVRLEGIGKTYPGGMEAVRPLTLEIREGELLAVVGPSGCGKSTLLRMVAGLERPTAGRLWIAGRDVTDVPPEERDIAMVFQTYALYPHKSVRENLAFPLRMRGASRQEIERRVAEVAATLGLTALLDRRPRALSGGQRQRVALGRAMVREPAAFLLDEPLSNLDAQLRVETRAELARMQRALGATMLYVTHDQEEALTLGDRVAVMNRGVLQQVAAPLDVYRAPANRFVAGFIGSPAMNFFQGEIVRRDGSVEFQSPAVSIPLEPSWSGPAGAVVLGVRPPDIEMVPDPGECSGVVDVLEPTGATTHVHLRVNGVAVRVLLSGGGSVGEGERVGLRFRRDALHWFDPQSGARRPVTPRASSSAG